MALARWESNCRMQKVQIDWEVSIMGTTSELQQRQVEMAKLHSEAASIHEQQKSQLEFRVHQEQSYIVELKGQITHLQLEVSSLRDDAARSTARQTNEQVELAKLQSEANAIYQEDRARLSFELQQAQAHAANLQSQLAASSQSLEGELVAKDRIRDEAAAVTDEARRQLLIQVAELQIEIEGGHQNCEGLTIQLRDAQSETTRLHKELAEAMTEAAQVSSQPGSPKEVSHWQHKTVAARAEVDHMHRKLNVWKGLEQDRLLELTSHLSELAYSLDCAQIEAPIGGEIDWLAVNNWVVSIKHHAHNWDASIKNRAPESPSLTINTNHTTCPAVVDIQIVQVLQSAVAIIAEIGQVDHWQPVSPHSGQPDFEMQQLIASLPSVCSHAAQHTRNLELENSELRSRLSELGPVALHFASSLQHSTPFPLSAVVWKQREQVMQNNSSRIRLIIWQRNCRVARSIAELEAARLETAQLRDESNGVIREAIAKGEQACATAELMQKKADTTEQDGREKSEKMATEASELQDEYMHFKLQIEVTSPQPL